MKAKYNSAAKTKWTRSHRKEEVKCFLHTYQIVSTDPQDCYRREARSLVNLRLYGTGNSNTACLWVGVPAKGSRLEIYTQGSGRAGGYGYHRPSAAAGEAIRNAGFELLTDEGRPADIGGVGDSAIREALYALADCLGLENWMLVESYA